MDMPEKIDAAVATLRNAGAAFDRLNEFQSFFIPIELNRRIVRRVSARANFRRVPETMPAVIAPLIAAGFPNLIGKFLHQIFSADKSKPDDSRANVGRGDQIDLSVAETNAIRPAAVRNFFHLNRSR